MSNGDKKYDNVLKVVRASALPREFLEKAQKGEPLSDEDIATLKSDLSDRDDLMTVQFTPGQFGIFGTYDGNREREFLCQVLSIDKHIPVIDKDQIHELEQGKIKASSLSMDGFLEDDIMRYDFELNDWEPAREHRGETAGQDYFFYDNNDAFFDLLHDEIEKRSPQSTQEHDAPDLAND